MFGKKKQNDKPIMNYVNWEADFGFLLLMINTKVRYAKTFNIQAFAQLLKNKNDFIHDKDIDGEENEADNVYLETVDEIYSSLSNNYKNYLIEKYFGTEKALITFISESVREDILISAIQENQNKIKKDYAEKSIATVSELNQMNKERK